MSVTVGLGELLDMAFGTPESGSPQLGALRILLRGLLQHLQPRDAPAQVGEGDGGVLEPPAIEGRGKAGSLHQQRWPGLGRAEGQPPGGLAAETRPRVQLKNGLEVTEEGMTKVMDMMQEMHTTICSLKTTVEGFQEELKLLKDSFQKGAREDLQEQSVHQEEHGHLLQSILEQLVEVQQELSSFPCNTAAPCWSSVWDVPTGENLSGQELGAEPSQEPAQEVPCKLSWLLDQYEVVGTSASHYESHLQHPTHVGTSEDTAAQPEKVPSEMRHLKDGGEKGLDFGRQVLDQVGQLQEQCSRLQEAAERLWGDTKDTQEGEKAELETKASQEDLQCAMVQLREVMQDLLQRMSQMDQDRQKALENLLNKIDSKLDSVALPPQQTPAEQLPHHCLCQGSCCAATWAAGFKRQLFEPVKCISCNRPLATAPAQPLVTVRKSQFLQTQPAHASASHSPAQRLPRESKGRGSSRASRGPASPVGALSRSSSLLTICPCGNPADYTCKTREVDILGTDGIIYKGRLSSPPASRAPAVGKDPPGAAIRRPSSWGAGSRLPRGAAGQQAPGLAGGL
ncbi:uncharacterized protein C16orf96 homolog isoform X2 [Heliangelus exortis]|uniref:uncharacterized protein C16orf96 homolog isoform X2 n=1 Tax=Heliangelus exortis TaxID=472823 RepID=UPI003A9025D5